MMIKKTVQIRRNLRLLVLLSTMNRFEARRFLMQRLLERSWLLSPNFSQLWGISKSQLTHGLRPWVAQHTAFRFGAKLHVLNINTKRRCQANDNPHSAKRLPRIVESMFTITFQKLLISRPAL